MKRPPPCGRFNYFTKTLDIINTKWYNDSRTGFLPVSLPTKNPQCRRPKVHREV